MIVLLNGPFGVGKTTVARLLVQRLEGARLYDPEWAGFLVRRTVARGADYQKRATWRLLTVMGARFYRLRSPTLVVPMTFWRKDVYEVVATGLRRVDPSFAQFVLTADEEILRTRIRADTVEAGAREWRLDHVERCLEAFRDPRFGPKVETGERSPTQVVDEIVAAL